MRRAAAGRVPVAGGEQFNTRYGSRDALAGRWVDTIQPDVGYCGGPVELTHIAAVADAFGIVVALHDSSGPVSTPASLHAAVTIANLKMVELFDDFLAPFVGDAVIGHPVARDGYLELPTAPGLGVELDFDVIAEHPYERRVEPVGRRLGAPVRPGVTSTPAVPSGAPAGPRLARGTSPRAS